MKSIIQLGLRIYFNKIEVNGIHHIPENTRAIIFTPNHQGAFLDALIVGAFSPQPIYSLTRASVFKPGVKWFLEALNMMPVYRIRDGYRKISKNQQIFESSKNLLIRNKAMLIFPEAEHHEHYYLKKISKGFARIALSAQNESPKESVLIIPVGINYFNLFYPRHKLILNFAPPIKVEEFLKTYARNRIDGLNALRETVFIEMKNSVLIPEHNEYYNSNLNLLSRKNEKLNFKALSGKTNKHGYIAQNKYPILKYVTLPLLVVNILPHAFSYWVLNYRTREIEFLGSMKFAFGLLLFPIWWFFVFVILGTKYGIGPAVVLLLLQISCLILRQEILRYAH